MQSKILVSDLFMLLMNMASTPTLTTDIAGHLNYIMLDIHWCAKVLYKILPFGMILRNRIIPTLKWIIIRMMASMGIKLRLLYYLIKVS